MTRSALQKCELNDNSWPQFVSAIKLNLGSKTALVVRRLRVSYFLTSIAESKFVLIEFSPELMNVNVDELMETLMLLEKGRL